MRAIHHTRQADYRSPFGALEQGKSVELTLDIFDEYASGCTLRVWVDGQGEQLHPMTQEGWAENQRFAITLTPAAPALYWYSFHIHLPDGSTVHYGAREGAVGGEGALYRWEPPSFQLTVYERRELPPWYQNAVVYQIFPDRFHRGADWRERAKEALETPRLGPARVLEEDWNTPPRYQKDPDGRVTQWSFYGGTLRGIEEKLSYLKGLGVTALYLCPIFQAASNHRYDTGDYTKIDKMLGTEEDFTALCAACEEKGISVILDGVFNHTGCDSLYFDKYGNYGGTGAWQKEASPYRKWFHFDDSAAGYACWWGVDDLPAVNKNHESYRAFLYGGEDSVVRRWLRAGAKGWRLDVADELPDDLIAGIKSAILAEKPQEGLLLGEVWEDASNKISYGQLRKYLLGRELDSAMNYPLGDAVTAFVLGSLSAGELWERVMSLYENYPPQAFYGALNLVGSHDRPRILTILGEAPGEETLTEEERFAYRLPERQRSLAKGRLWLLALLQMTLPGVPCLYYGDEVGAEGYRDPYNRGPYPWDKGDPDTWNIYRNAVALRKLSPVFTQGEFTPFYDHDEVFGFSRGLGEESAVVLINRSPSASREVTFPALGEAASELISGLTVKLAGGGARLTLPPMSAAVVYFPPERRLGKTMARGSGVLCHVTSLPDGGEGLFEKCRGFIDFLEAAGQSYWQILPLNPTDEHGSPYAGASAFAGNIALLGLEEADLRARYHSFIPDDDYALFQAENEDWLLPYALFSALREQCPHKPWQGWEERYRSYDPALCQEPEIRGRVDYHIFAQYLFHREWRRVRDYARAAGVSIIGDMPMYVSADSADAWAHPQLFTLDEKGYPTMEAGVPPDYFAVEGQLWGNPLYRWEAMEEAGYGWWLARFRRAFGLYDYVRLDHFRGFESYWAVPAGEKATKGAWQFGPGAKLFEAAYAALGPLPVVAEDLGLITPAVRGLLARCGFPGAEVLQFADGDPLVAYNPSEGKIVYSGTHDNATLLGWCRERYPESDPEETAKILLSRLFSSPAEMVITPLQDILGLGDEARMNVPGTTGSNWQWKAKEEDFKGAGERLLEFTRNARR